MPETPAQKRITLRDVARMKREGQKLVVVTAYDVLFARVVDSAGVDIVLVGDSVGNVVAGFDSTLPVKLEHMIYHGAAVRRGIQRALLVVDMPFLSYQASVERAILNCGRVLQETGADAVKVEGGSPEMVSTVAALTRTGIPVMAHLGFTPQSVRSLGMRIQGREHNDADRITEGDDPDARAAAELLSGRQQTPPLLPQTAQPHRGGEEGVAERRRDPRRFRPRRDRQGLRRERRRCAQRPDG